MNRENILCGNHRQVPGDRARVRNYTCSNAFLGEKIDILLSRLSLSSNAPRIWGTTSSPLWVTCLWFITAERSQDTKSVFPTADRAGFQRCTLIWRSSPNCRPGPFLWWSNAGAESRLQAKRAASYSKGCWRSLFFSQVVKEYLVLCFHHQ